MNVYILNTKKFLLLVALIIVFLQWRSLAAGDGDKEKERFMTSQLSLQPEGTLVNINNISMWIYSDGTSANDPEGNSGTIYPRGTGEVIYQDGIVWGGQVRDGESPLIRVGGQTYSIGTVPGSIVSKGIAEDFNDPDVNRIWRIRRDYRFADLREDAAELNLKTVEEVTDAEVETVRARYERDWVEWPWEKGAPFYDAEGDGVYSPRFHSDGTPMLFPEADEPGIVNADQVVWLVYNDLEENRAREFVGSPPVGLEMQLILWGYRRSDALGNIIFKQYKFIYKGTLGTITNSLIDSMFIGQWSDPDLGSAGDDFAGCDTLLDLGYCYNAFTVDTRFTEFNLPPPAIGYDLLVGPIVPSSSGEAIFGLKRRSGFVNLPLTSFSFKGAGDAGGFPPCRGNLYNCTLQWWNLLRGYHAFPTFDPEPQYDPLTGQKTTFAVPGDPVTGVGYIDSYPGSRRIFSISGPFTMALGDTNEITVGLVAGLGSDRLMSVTAMKYYDRVAQEVFENLFIPIQPPPSPELSASELNGKILLNWSSSQESVEAIEQWQEAGHQFEGYNIYQLPSANSGIYKGIKLATIDLKNEVTTIIQEQFDSQSASIVTMPVQVGRNSGIVRTMLVERDELNDQPLINGKEYHFAITSYSFKQNRQSPVKSLESVPSIVSVTPHSLNPGVNLGSTIGDTLPVVHEQGGSDGKVYPIVVDPSRLTGDTYEVVFNTNNEGVKAWSLVNTTANEILLSDQTNQSGDENYLITDGLQVKVVAVRSDFKRFAMVSNGNGPITETFGFEVTPSPTTYTGYSVDWYRDVLLSANGGVLAEGGPDGVAANGGFYFFVAGGNTVIDYETARGRILRQSPIVAIPNDYEMRWTEEGGKGWMAFTSGSCVDVPFQLWYLGSNTLDDPSDDVRMLPRIFDDNQNDEFDFKLDHAASGAENDPYTDWVNYMMPVDDSPGDAGYQAYAAAGCDESAAGGVTEHLARTVIMNYDQSAGDGSVNVYPEPGVTIRIEMSKSNSPNDLFTFSTSDYKPTFSEDQARKDIKEINVFPNPYYGLFRVDTRGSDRFVTFSHLPEKANIRIFNLAGILVRKIQKDSESQFEKWDLLSERGRAVAGGIYIAHIEMPELGVSKILKLAVFHK